MNNSVQNEKKGLSPYMSPVGALSFALGTSIGWGSLVITSNTYLAQAGPLGSILGILIGAAVMLIISRNYSYMMNRCTDAGGAYTFAKKAFGYDHGFLTAWFLALTYIAIFWANATSLPLFARYFLGDIFRFGFLYSIFGYDVYLGEALLTIAAIILFGLLCMNFKKILAHVMVAMALLFAVGISICFAAAMLRHSGTGYSFDPVFIPDKSALSQVIRIACISPWAFIGFENISHASEEFNFSKDKILRILTAAVILATALYIFITLLSVTAYPPEYGSWMEYINDLGNLQGIKGLPAFYAANHYLGRAGVTILILSLFALIITSLIGNITALSRLNYALAKDDILPAHFADLNKRSIPWKAVMLIAAASLAIPFFGRTAIGWIVDVTTIGATIIYGFVSASAFKTSRDLGDKLHQWTGLIGMVVMIAFGLSLVVPELFSSGTIEKETYFLFTVWTILGFIFFRHILKKDLTNRFGRSIIVWIALLALILFTSLVWLSQSTMALTNSAMDSVREYFGEILDDPHHMMDAETFLAQKMDSIHRANIRSMLVVTGFFSISIFILINNYSLMKTRVLENETALERAKNIANIDPLTGVKSKRAFAENEKILNEAIRAGMIDEFSIAVCDINGLKYINDTFGHKAGDKYICSACKIICDLFSHSPVFRIGGDEFAIILTGSDHADRRSLMDRLNKQSEAAIIGEGVVIAAGISDYSHGHDTNVNSVFERADTIMYARKKALKEMGAKTR